ncbi:MAG: heme lyase CcmF/NrfE family subunit [Gammaproteobacteria bacterium]|nr:heme lyase CcmF/NrfE family subunit [Gammaproteobacteria bacterium]MDD9823792.1 heme lyase CcmF/NrfE family subunit [Gammaproteobacteria bacterium]MDD9864699.1 heme lyase CcmF/NrfE family subunit [Gammaproteobacteria bacterium]
MIVELGLFCLALALGASLIQAILPLMGAAYGVAPWMAVARPMATIQFVCLALAFGALTQAFVNHDFSVLYVAQNSNSALPLGYRVSAVWGAHEGSLLLWSLVLGLWTLAVAMFSRSLPDAFAARLLGILGIISVGFLLFMLLTSNPFERHFPAPPDGADLNPLLQDPGLIFHPPMLYMGYVGFAVAFAFAATALLEGRLDLGWARWARPWAIAAWVFLTLGIALGSWWAYYELGWGGWWFWDPVENASFMPWLVGTALIHSLAATDKRGVYRNWSALLAICAFALSLLGTFLVRSGVLTSVHAFATDPERGVFILGLLAVFVGGALALFAWRAPNSPAGPKFRPMSRETFLLVNAVTLTVSTATILLGTLYPLAAEVLGMGKLSVGPPYFNAVFVPLMAPVIVLVGMGPLVRWRADAASALWPRLRAALWGSVLVGVACAALLTEDRVLPTACGAGMAAWIALGTLQTLRLRLAAGRQNLSSGFYGMCLAHMGLAVTMCGILVSSLHSDEAHKRMAVGDSAMLAGYEFRLAALRSVPGPNYRATEAEFHVARQGRTLVVLHSQKRNYSVRDAVMTEAGIDGGLLRDLYVSLGEPLGNGAWSVRLHYKPLVRWIWLGALVMGLGGTLALSDPRYRTAWRRRNLPQGLPLATGTQA